MKRYSVGIWKTPFFDEFGRFLLYDEVFVSGKPTLEDFTNAITTLLNVNRPGNKVVAEFLERFISVLPLNGR